MERAEELISIIMPVYNSALTVKEAISSVIGQSYKHWELLVINDGSTDDSHDLISSFLSDRRILYYKQENKGVSSARNLGLTKMKGNYFCFLDSDDKLPVNSLRSRLTIFKQDEEINFVDGVVEKMDSSLHKIEDKFTPKLQNGNPLNDLVSLNGKCFFGLSWMIKRVPGGKYQFKEDLFHAEDLLFYMNLARCGGDYDFTPDPIYIYRNSPGSAMKNTEGLEKGYWQVYEEIKQWSELRWFHLLPFKARVRKIMFLSYLREGKRWKALKALI